VRRVLRASDRALLVEEADLGTSMRVHAALAAELEAGGLVGVTELIPAARTILVPFDPSRVEEDTLRRRLLDVRPADERAARAEVVTIPVHYDGQDLDEVAELLGVSAREVVARHTAATWRVAFTGFAPGFGYLVGDDPFFDVPRRTTPRTRIPAGSVGLAGDYSGVYPRESPGGWQLIGRTDETMFDLLREPPALFVPGHEVRFTVAERESVALSAASDVASTAGVAGHAVEVVRPGLQLLVEDLGRPGNAALGVSASGAADRRALRDANRAVGNRADSAVLEQAGGGAVLRFRGDTVVAIAGAPADAQLRPVEGDPVPVPTGVAVAVADGDELHLRGLAAGLRVAIAVRGGFALAPALGSVAVDTLGGIGPLDLPGLGLSAGDVVPASGPAAAPGSVDPHVPAREDLPRAGDVVELRIVLGPRDDWFTPDALATLTTQEWSVTARSDRVGVRLQGDVALERSRDGELPSEGAVTGAIQVPPDGQPVLFLPDHPLTGGYPIIGAVVDRDLDLAGQLPPGARIRFRVVDAAID